MRSLYKLAIERKSVRTYDGRGVTDEDRQRLSEFIETIRNPFDIPIRFKILDAGEYGLESSVLTGEKTFVAAKTDNVPGFEVAYGYSFQQLVLYAKSIGIGTCWIGGTMNREAFHKAVDLTENEIMPCVTPIGYPAAKAALKDTMMRKGIKADVRKDYSEFLFKDNLDTPLPQEEIDKLKETYEILRWAPSAVNRQPWRIVVKDGYHHFFEKKRKGYAAPETGDLQKIDVGIALCHFDLALKEQGMTPTIEVLSPDIDIEEDMEYVVSLKA